MTERIENPFQSPAEPVPQAKVIPKRSGSRNHLRRIATYQHVVVVCLLVQAICYPASIIVPDVLYLKYVVLRILFAAVVIGVSFAILLAMKVFNSVIGVLLGVLTIVPGLGLIVLFCINQRATYVLRKNDVQVGFFGADSSKI